jgi:hypothetical protein
MVSHCIPLYPISHDIQKNLWYPIYGNIPIPIYGNIPYGNIPLTGK